MKPRALDMGTQMKCLGPASPLAVPADCRFSLQNCNFLPRKVIFNPLLGVVTRILLGRGLFLAPREGGPEHEYIYTSLQKKGERVKTIQFPKCSIRRDCDP